jgi:2-polyprenyl-6-methoxyphenol hydroxylase-like FAD-dependent oxidoreductase
MTIVVSGLGISGLAFALALSETAAADSPPSTPPTIVIVERQTKQGWSNEVGTGMSLIGHALPIVARLTRQPEGSGRVCASASIPTSISLSTRAGVPLFDVPMDSDDELVAAFGTVQVNVDRGALVADLLASLGRHSNVTIRWGATIVSVGERTSGAARGVSRHVRDDEVPPPGTDPLHLVLDDGRTLDASLLVVADGIHSRLASPVLRRASAAQAWRGILPVVPGSPDDRSFWCAACLASDAPCCRCMAKSVDNGCVGVSFTTGSLDDRRFWAIDAVPDVATTLRADLPLNEALTELAAQAGLAPHWLALIAATPADAIRRTWVVDGPLWPICPPLGSHVLALGDAAHPMVHHFGQGAVVALEDAVIAADTVATHGATASAVRAYRWSPHHLRTTVTVGLSRAAGAAYMTRSHVVRLALRLALAPPAVWLATLVIRLLFFVSLRLLGLPLPPPTKKV